jgi:hypothetical protein
MKNRKKKKCYENYTRKKKKKLKIPEFRNSEKRTLIDFFDNFLKIQSFYIISKYDKKRDSFFSFFFFFFLFLTKTICYIELFEIYKCSKFD